MLGRDEKSRGCWDLTEQKWHAKYEEWYSEDCSRNCSCELTSRGKDAQVVAYAATCSSLRCRHRWQDGCPEGQKVRRVQCCDECIAIDRMPKLATWRNAKKTKSIQNVCSLAKPCQVGPLRERSPQCINPIPLPVGLCPKQICSTMCAGQKACFLPQISFLTPLSWLKPGEVWRQRNCGTCICVEGNLLCKNSICNTDLKEYKNQCHNDDGQVTAGFIKAILDPQQNNSCSLCMCNGPAWNCNPYSFTSSDCHQIYRRQMDKLLRSKKELDEHSNDSVYFQHSNLVIVLILFSVVIICLILSGSGVLCYYIKLRRKNIHESMKNKTDDKLATTVLLNNHKYSTSVTITKSEMMQ